MSELTIVSIVATGTADAEIDLESVSKDLDVYSLRYNPTDSPGLYVKFYEGGPTVTLFRTGSFDIRGASEFEEIGRNKSVLNKELSRIGMDICLGKANISNIVFTGELEKEMDLNKVSLKLGLNHTEYEPEQFPGLVYRLEVGVVLIFSSGRLVLTGFTELEDARQAYDRVASELS